MFSKVIRNATYREQPQPPPDVSLQVSMPALLAPPFPTQDKSVKPKMVKEPKVKIQKGMTYDIITASVVAKVRVEKIWQHQEYGNTYIVISQQFPQGRKTHALSIQEFKQRLLLGGVSEVEI